MQHDTFEFSAFDGVKLHGQSWQTANPKAVIAVVHGFGEHGGRYEAFARFFNQHGYAVIAYDRRGHGLSLGKRGHAMPYSAYIKEIGDFYRQVSQRFPQLPIVLYGHSQGGQLAMLFEHQEKPQLQAIVASAPLLRLAFEPSAFLITLGRLTRKLLPSFTQPNGIVTKHLSRDPQVATDYEQDKLVHTKVSSETGLGLIEWGKALENIGYQPSAPLLLHHGDQDQIVSFPATQAFAKTLKGDVTFQAWVGGYHEAHQDLHKEEVLNFVLQWLEKRS